MKNMAKLKAWGEFCFSIKKCSSQILIMASLSLLWDEKGLNFFWNEMIHDLNTHGMPETPLEH
ncbi:hypothetical protein ECDEC10F_2962 [Escherichia coli DEC10F]|nr:hypothetical protein ECDEC10F_2962 [Escherichia coli DEC10F]